MGYACRDKTKYGLPQIRTFTQVRADLKIGPHGHARHPYLGSAHVRIWGKLGPHLVNVVCPYMEHFRSVYGEN